MQLPYITFMNCIRIQKVVDGSAIVIHRIKFFIVIVVRPLRVISADRWEIKRRIFTVAVHAFGCCCCHALKNILK